VSAWRESRLLEFDAFVKSPDFPFFVIPAKETVSHFEKNVIPDERREA